MMGLWPIMSKWGFVGHLEKYIEGFMTLYDPIKSI
jgi:hypothetical protein